MPIKFSCPHCKKGLSVKEQLAGKKGVCPDCKKVVVIPALPTPPVTPNAAAPATGPAAQPAPKAPTAAPRAPTGTSKAAAPSKAPTAPPNATGTAPRAPSSINKVPSTTPPKTSPPPPAAPPRPEDVEAEAAALFSDEPANKPTEEPKFVDFNCPFCDEGLHLDAELAGKKTSCPECKRIIKVPELVKVDPKDWRQAQSYQGPSGARRPTEPAPEGTWESNSVKGVSQGALVEAGLVPVKATPVPLRRRIILGTLAAAFLLALGYGSLSLYHWFGRNKEEKALREALVYADSEGAHAKVGGTGQAALHIGIAGFYLHQKAPESGTRAREHLNKALSLLQNASKEPDNVPKDALLDRTDAALIDLAHAYLELGDGRATTDLDKKKGWDDTHRALQATLLAIRSSQAREEAVRQVTRGLVARDQTARVQPLVSTLYQTLPGEKLAGLSACALELVGTGHKTEAEALASQVLAAYPSPEEVKKRKAKDPKKKITIPPLESGAVALALVLEKKEVPKPSTALNDRYNDRVGQAEGLARRGDTDNALKLAREAPTDTVRFEALVAMAGAGKDSRALDEAVDLAPRLKDHKDRSELDWLLLRLMTIGTEKGLAEDRLLNVADAIADRSLRARAQLGLLRARLKADRPVEEAEVEKIDPHYLAHALARQVLAHQKVRHDSGWAKTVEGWTEPVRAFGFLGVALGLQGP